MSQNNVTKQIDSVNNLSYQTKIANTTKFLKIYQDNVAKAQKINYKKGIADSYSNLSLMYYFQGKYDLNTKFILKATRLYQQLNLKDKQANSFAVYGYQLKLRDMNSAVMYMQKGMKLAESIKDEFSLSGIYDNYGVLKEMQNELDSALFFYNKSLKIKEKLKDNTGIPYSANKIALVKLMQNKPREAKSLLDYAFKIRKDIKDIYGIAENLNYYGFYFKQIKDDKQSINYFNQAIEWSKKHDFPYLTQDNFKELSSVYERNKDFRKALQAFKNHIEVKDSIFNSDVRNKQSELDIEYETEQKEKEILIQKAKLAEKNLWILGGFSLTIIAILLGFLLFSKQKQKTLQLQKENELKDALLKIETQNKLQEQRLRISRDLHDNIGSQLTFIISTIDNLKYGLKDNDQKIINKLHSLSGFTKETIAELRDTIWAMNKDKISFEDLKIRISNFIENAQIASNGIDFEFNCQDNFAPISLSSVEGINSYRIIQESINNALKHAKATKVSVEVLCENQFIEIIIKDNGIGFDEENTVLGNGLSNLKKRAKELNGEILVTSQLKKGTTIVLKFNKK
ncbi:MAG: sensor histidine kinase [Flavobacterium sp.]|uniref:tetratricopeptide repeat-containing sensor histidine kinase n=1 Tax=Flavobacterium sp. TaxID=239 RepID=UPI0022C9DCAC|nr:sensor histidine kinase [Flavobacterium sp.]MCZ8091469.1 sensor histidine kinase [Flavobacterium sp.]MCZ8331134.1 sensor histidine kinase [Flavobacterium sp.]